MVKERPLGSKNKLGGKRLLAFLRGGRLKSDLKICLTNSVLSLMRHAKACFMGKC